jgi:hypothetical protein
MASNKLKKIRKKIGLLKQKLVSIGDMRPGTLTVQYRKPAEKEIPFNQISYTYKGKSRSEYVRPENLGSIKEEIEAYKLFKSTINQIIELSIQASKLKSLPE